MAAVVCFLPLPRSLPAHSSRYCSEQGSSAVKRIWYQFLRGLSSGQSVSRPLKAFCHELAVCKEDPARWWRVFFTDGSVCIYFTYSRTCTCLPLSVASQTSRLDNVSSWQLPTLSCGITTCKLQLYLLLVWAVIHLL